MKAYMCSHFCKTLFLLFLVISINGCKPDPAVYPTKIIPIPGYTGTDTTGTGTGPGTGTNNGEGLPLGPVGTIKVKIDDETVTYTTASFGVSYPGSPGAVISPSTGDIDIIGIGTNAKYDFFTLIILGSKTGTFDIHTLVLATFANDEAKGKAKVTVLNNTGVLQGSFAADLVDENKKTHHVLGSFNIKK